MNKVLNTALKALFLLFVALSSKVVFAQDSSSDDEHRLSSQWSLNIGNKNGIGFEHPIGRHFSMVYSAGLLVNHRFQPYALPRMLSHYGNAVIVASEYSGISPYVRAGFNWYPHVKANNTGFYLGLSLNYTHNKLKFAVIKDKYRLEREVLLVPAIGYKWNIAKRLNTTMAFTPVVGGGVANEGRTRYGNLIDLRWDLGLSYTL